MRYLRSGTRIYLKLFCDRNCYAHGCQHRKHDGLRQFFCGRILWRRMGDTRAQSTNQLLLEYQRFTYFFRKEQSVMERTSGDYCIYAEYNSTCMIMGRGYYA